MGCHSTSDLPLSSWRLCCHFSGNVTLVALVSSPSLCWKLLPHLFFAGVTALDAPMLLPALRWRLCQHCAGVVALFTLALLPSLCCHHCPAGVSVIVVLALFPFALVLSPLSCWSLHQCCACVIAFVVMVSLSFPFICLLPSVTLSLTLTAALNVTQCPNLPKLAQTCVHNGCSCNAITSFAAGDGFLVVAILQAIIPGILDGQCLCGPCLVGLRQTRKRTHHQMLLVH